MLKNQLTFVAVLSSSFMLEERVIAELNGWVRVSGIILGHTHHSNVATIPM